MVVYNCAEYSVRLDDKKGALLSLVKGEKEFVCQEAILPLFTVRLRGEKGEITLVDAYDATIHSTVQEGNTYKLFFGGFSKVDLSVSATVTFGAQIEWDISVKNNSDLCIEWVDYPQIAVPDDLKGSGGDAEIFWGFNEGAVVSDLERRDISWFYYDDPEYPSRGTAGIFPAAVEIPFLAYYGSKGGLYFGAHDREGYVKGIDFRKVGEGIKLQYRLFSGLNPGESFSMDYPLVMDFFMGDWYAAADIYRKWFESDKTEGFVKINENPMLPDWYGESPVILTYPVRGLHDTDIMNPNKLFPYVAAMPHVERLSKELDSKIMVILMHWEGTAPWAPPYMWPPYGGVEALKEYVDELHKKGHLIGLYCSGTGWTYKSKLIAEYDNSQRFIDEGRAADMCISPEGELPFSNICPAQRIGYDMCPSREYTMDVLTTEAKNMASVGVDYIQLLDQNHGGTSYFCYSREHGHPAMPGKWQTDAMRKIYEAVGEATNNKETKLLFGCESAAAETFIPYLLFSDNRFELSFAIGKAVPAYAYIYHEYVNNFMGNQVCTGEFFDHAKSPENILFRIAYSFSAGDMLTLVINEDGDIAWNWGEKLMPVLPEQEPIKKLVRNLNSWRRGMGKDFLHKGRMMAPYTLKQPENILIAMQGDKTIDCDRILSTCWQSEDGRNGQVLINYSAEDVKCSICLCDAENYEVYDDAFGEAIAEGTIGKEGTEVEITVPALSAVMVICK